jgi:hypothetical protein
MALLERKVLLAVLATVPGHYRREVGQRLEQVEMDLLKLQGKVLQLERNLVEADIDELRFRVAHHFSRAPDLPSDPG